MPSLSLSAQLQNGKSKNNQNASYVSSAYHMLGIVLSTSQPLIHLNPTTSHFTGEEAETGAKGRTQGHTLADAEARYKPRQSGSGAHALNPKLHCLSPTSQIPGRWASLSRQAGISVFATGAHNPSNRVQAKRRHCHSPWERSATGSYLTHQLLGMRFYVLFCPFFIRQGTPPRASARPSPSDLLLPWSKYNLSPIRQAAPGNRG